jgi:CheY-like chemotaxis protein
MRSEIFKELNSMTSILIVDDAAFSRRMIRKMFKSDPYEILEASNGREALEIISTHQPNCILTDLLMPDMDGFEFLSNLQAQKIDIPTIIISADIQESSRDRCLELGAVAFINKPPKENIVRQTIQQIFNPKG